ncbi:MAG: GNAT family N-acetyltransferase [Methanoregula sp.]|jgi:ribosomal protein S18 acetylase RimI-like enzyme|nr:GNAT family N-acetyltransferase [Methanoregula sp.]
MGSEIIVRLVRSWDEHEIVDLYRAGGWWKEEYAEAEIPTLIQGSFLFAVAVHEKNGKAVGMGRVLSDGISDGYIQDLVVLPACRGTGLGKMIVGTLVDACKKAGLTWIALIAEPETEPFYQQLGFAPMAGYVPLLYRGDPRC